MALGSVATLLVLAAAIIEGPKLLHSSASSAAPQVAAPVESKAAESTATPAAPPPQPTAQQDSAPPAQTAPAQAPAEPAATPVQAAAPQTPARSAPAQKQARGQSSPAGVAQPAAGQRSVAQQPPQSSQQPPQQTQPPAPARPTAAEMNELRQNYNQVAIRVGAAKSGLRALQQQMQRQGVDMRGDMLEAESRMDYLMKESMDSMRAGDADGSRTSLQMAERSLETIEKFLGR